MTKRYILVRSDNVYELQENVNDMIKEGYVPQGGIQAMHERDGFGNRFYQAMVKKWFMFW